ncbi:MAG: hypothetical protein K6G61_05435 [Solobacterium sp.]|nr:hypothetical protein [Solobacterium sp.]
MTGNFFERLLASVPSGRRNAIPMKMLAMYWGIDERELRKFICEARKEGYFILSSPDGYFKPETLSEAHCFVNSMHERALTALRSIQPLRKTLKEYGVTSPNNIPLYVDEDQEFPYMNPVHTEGKKKKPFQARFMFEEEEELEE